MRSLQTSRFELLGGWNVCKHGSQEKTQERERTWSKNLFPANTTKASAAVPRIEEMRENSEKNSSLSLQPEKS